MTHQQPSIDLAAAIELIVSNSPLCATEQVDLQAAMGRVLANTQFANHPQPEFDQSTRDGFVLADSGVELGEGSRRYRVEGEVAAGSDVLLSLAPTTASRIMTGGLIPDNGSRVIPFENCLEQNGHIIITEELLTHPQTFIRRRGCVLESGRQIMEKGEIIGPGHLALLASTGNFAVDVHKRLKVAYFCTGSELLRDGEATRPGKKISTNRYLLHGLINSFGAVPDDRGVVQDSISDLTSIVEILQSDNVDIIISTGGMGPGKYDLLQQVFQDVGGRVLYSSLTVRPGKATLFGLLGAKLFFGLPGPPPAVRVLFNELVRPALLIMQGLNDMLPPTMSVELLEDVHFRKEAVLGLKGGIVANNTGYDVVRLARGVEVPNCYLLLEPERTHYQKGEQVTIHRTESPFSAC